MYLVLSSAQVKKAAGVFSGCLGIQPHAHTLHGAPLEPRDLHLRDVQELGRALLRQAVIKRSAITCRSRSGRRRSASRRSAYSTMRVSCS